MKHSVYQLADAYETTVDIISEIFDEAHEKLKAYAEQNGYDCTIHVDEGEVYLENNNSDFFEEDVQTIFDEFVSQLLCEL